DLLISKTRSSLPYGNGGERNCFEWSRFPPWAAANGTVEDIVSAVHPNRASGGSTQMLPSGLSHH
ncbi:hypothetical protein ABTM76_20480, partial [Acinetobacter baumannii]